MDIEVRKRFAQYLKANLVKSGKLDEFGTITPTQTAIGKFIESKEISNNVIAVSPKAIEKLFRGLSLEPTK